MGFIELVEHLEDKDSYDQPPTYTSKEQALVSLDEDDNKHFAPKEPKNGREPEPIEDDPEEPKEPSFKEVVSSPTTTDEPEDDFL